jgi:hypothetical protein
MLFAGSGGAAASGTWTDRLVGGGGGSEGPPGVFSGTGSDGAGVFASTSRGDSGPGEGEGFRARAAGWLSPIGRASSGPTGGRAGPSVDWSVGRSAGTPPLLALAGIDAGGPVDFGVDRSARRAAMGAGNLSRSARWKLLPGSTLGAASLTGGRLGPGDIATALGGSVGSTAGACSRRPGAVSVGGSGRGAMGADRVVPGGGRSAAESGSTSGGLADIAGSGGEADSIGFAGSRGAAATSAWADRAMRCGGAGGAARASSLARSDGASGFASASTGNAGATLSLGCAAGG